MAKKLEPATKEQRKLVEDGIAKLRQARDCFVLARSPQTADAVRKAIKSASGALRHVDRRLRKTTI